VERNDRLLLPLLKPKVPGNPAVMFIDLAVPLAPVVEGRDVELRDEPPGADLGLLRANVPGKLLDDNGYGRTVGQGTRLSANHDRIGPRWCAGDNWLFRTKFQITVCERLSA
jgi:hypothetical protein